MNLRILIVDDSAAVRRLIREEIDAHTGWAVYGEAENGQQAIEKAEELKPDLIVLDLSMPVMNGLQAAPTLRKLLPSTPIVMFTSFKTNHLRDQALKAGVTVMIEKSNSLTVLVNTIQSLFPEQSSGLGNIIA
jgi:DNA-binding NarL/FixJ family response regulator